VLEKNPEAKAAAIETIDINQDWTDVLEKLTKLYEAFKVARKIKNARKLSLSIDAPQ